jgi:diguanylate cyclase (GGDEF)-like protein
MRTVVEGGTLILSLPAFCEESTLPGTTEILIELARSAREGTPAQVIDAVANAVTQGTGFQEVAVSVYVPELDAYRTDFATGPDEARKAIVGRVVSAAAIERVIEGIVDEVPGIYFVPGELDRWSNIPEAYIPDIPASDNPHAWLAMDSLLAILRDSSGHPLGVISLDEPASGLRPEIEQLHLVGAIASHAEEALATARHNAQRDRSEQIGRALLNIATKLPHCENLGELGEMVCATIGDPLDFERIAIYSQDPEGSMTLRTVRGWELEDQRRFLPAVLDPERVAAVLTPDRETDGCWLIDAAELFPTADGDPRSRRNGHGRDCWRDNCLIVPAQIDESAELTLLVIEDPVDHLMPGGERRRVVRLVAEIATSARTAILQRTQLAHLATHDPLTGLRNRRGLDELLEGQRSVAVLVCDIDRFKQINDRYGHEGGDRVLQRFGELLLSLARTTDVAVRLGGEEFCLVLPQTDHPGALEAAERLRVTVQEQLTDMVEGGVTVSIGVATTTDGVLEAKDLLATADRRMYGAKQAGRNRVLG